MTLHELQAFGSLRLTYLRPLVLAARKAGTLALWLCLAAFVLAAFAPVLGLGAVFEALELTLLNTATLTLLGFALSRARLMRRLDSRAVAALWLVLLSGGWSVAVMLPALVTGGGASLVAGQDCACGFVAGVIAASALLRRSAPRLALMLALAALVLPLAELFGASMLNPRHLHLMPVFVAALLLFYGLSNLMGFLRRPWLRVFLLGSAVGRIARLQALVALVLLWTTGLVFTVMTGEAANPYGPLGLTVILLIVIVTISVSAASYDRADRRRRMLERQLKLNSVTDLLTGAVNRFGATLLMGAVSTRAPVGVIVCDLDDFKQVNDAFGHAAGDRALLEAAAAMRAATRRSDIFARWGGEEFLVVLPGAGVAATLAAAERLRGALLAVVGPKGQAGEITASFGVSVLREGEDGLEPAIRRADRALYSAKAAGRNRVAQEIEEPVVVAGNASQGPKASEG